MRQFWTCYSGCSLRTTAATPLACAFLSAPRNVIPTIFELQKMLASTKTDCRYDCATYSTWEYERHLLSTPALSGPSSNLDNWRELFVLPVFLSLWLPPGASFSSPSHTSCD
ncbi:hypothetical protein BU23DRAFT_11434 [Bimuria novae-zelandiae CBS 107.79]|uniref:Uncharacterized protein n=1 Tax=Bimuria novae-zelandiae CBS 107.79 TaxID=1447943 RepID=A0A6A5VLY6_9PLEO|nr:hypothetical protein BU23DRAFT_11434 [Bimuria novae-zelandiae CBS 107.79]